MEVLLIVAIVGGLFVLAAIFGGGPDKSRDELCAGLQTIGVDARMAERGRPEEKTGEGSLGLIDIGQGSVRWINARVEDRGETTVHMTEYGVTDSRYLPKIQIESVRVKTFPIFGRVIDVRWNGDDQGLGIVERLGSDSAIKDAIIGNGDELTVVARRDQGYWLIRREIRATPSAEQWGCYQAIAEHLLQVRVPGLQRPS